MIAQVRWRAQGQMSHEGCGNLRGLESKGIIVVESRSPARPRGLLWDQCRAGRARQNGERAVYPSFPQASPAIAKFRCEKATSLPASGPLWRWSSRRWRSLARCKCRLLWPEEEEGTGQPLGLLRNRVLIQAALIKVGVTGATVGAGHLLAQRKKT
jgi:hypothetical protein